MNEHERTPEPEEPGYSRRLRKMNDALLVSSVHQQELAEAAERASEELRKSRAELAAQLVETELLRSLSAEMIQGNVEALYGKIVETAAALMHSDCASLQIFHPERGDGGALHLLAHRGFTAEAISGWEWVTANDKTTCGVALATGARTIVPDIEQCEFLADTDALVTYQQTGIRSVQSTPLISRAGKRIGMLSTHWRRLHEPSPHEVQLCDLLARQAADLVDRSQAEDDLARAAEALADMSRRKDEFLAMLSHELRNPLAPIRTAVQLMRSQGRGSENLIERQAREIIERQVGNLTKIVSDLLEVSRVVTGRIRMDLQTVELNRVVEHAVETVQAAVAQHKHHLELTLCDAGVWVNGDVTRLEEVLVNLLSNAVKYTPDGGRIEVSCGQPAEANHAQVRVRDNGVGIEEELLRGGRIFDLFTQADRSLARSSGGLGIGLSLAHRLVDLHGGSIEAKSPPEGLDKGSEFIVRLPAVSPPSRPEEEEPEAPPPKAQGLRVLVVDDNIDLVMVLRTSLLHEGYSVRSAYSGPEGLRAAQEWRPDVVLLDIGLPGLDGYEVARRLRADPTLGASGSTVRLIAMTGYGREADLVLAREAGFDTHLTKPVEFKHLQKVLAAAAQEPPPP